MHIVLPRWSKIYCRDRAGKLKSSKHYTISKKSEGIVMINLKGSADLSFNSSGIEHEIWLFMHDKTDGIHIIIFNLDNDTLVFYKIAQSE